MTFTILHILLFHSKNEICFFSLVEVENLLGQKDCKRTYKTKRGFDIIGFCFTVIKNLIFSCDFNYWRY